MQNIFAIIRIGRIAQSLSSQKILNRFKEAVQKLKFFGFSVINRLIVNRIFRSYSLCEKKRYVEFQRTLMLYFRYG